MRIWHISDTHMHHHLLKIPEGIDIVIHSGDATNYLDPIKNEKEMIEFLAWYSQLPIPNKVFVAGNHDTSIEKGFVTRKSIEDLGIIYIYMETKEVAGLKIWGSPYCPRYGNWAFMKDRASMMKKVWDFMDPEADIIVTHTPAYGFLDWSDKRVVDNINMVSYTTYEHTGCKSLYKKIKINKPKLHCFGHIHNTSEVWNAGVFKPVDFETLFSNGACCKDRAKDRMKYNGNIIEL